MKCKKAETVLAPYHDGELGAWEHWRVRRHLGRCATCQAKLARLAELNALLRARAVEPSAEFYPRLAARLTARAAGERLAVRGPAFGPAPAPRARWRGWWLAPAGGAVAVGLAAYLLLVGNPTPLEPRGEELEIATNLELLENYEVIDSLDLLEEFDLLSKINLAEEG